MARIFICIFSMPALARAVFPNLSENDTLSILRSSSVEGSVTSLDPPTLLNGHASWHLSHPKKHLPIIIASYLSTCRLRSIVRYERHLEASREKGASSAPDGHESRHRVQEPHRLSIGSTDGISRGAVVNISAR